MRCKRTKAGWAVGATHLKDSFSSHRGASDCQTTAVCCTEAPTDTRAKACVLRPSPGSPSACTHHQPPQHTTTRFHTLATRLTFHMLTQMCMDILRFLE